MNYETESCSTNLSEPSLVYNSVLREDGQSFADAMCAGSIVEALDDETGAMILNAIKKAGDR
ncbi:MAG: hypothetical protein FWD35_04450 [Oscillospiraceae bacterium]|nr:hypothetical protein [Oscillospiraceae bacterium]